MVRCAATISQLSTVATEVSRARYNASSVDADELLQLAEKRLLEHAEGKTKEGGLEAMDNLLKNTIERSDA